MHFWDTNKCTGYFSAVGTQWSFSEITVAKPSLQRTFLMCFVSPIANQDILNQSWKMCFEFWAKRYFQWTQKSVHLYCYDSFDNKWFISLFGLCTTRKSKSDIKNKSNILLFIFSMSKDYTVLQVNLWNQEWLRDDVFFSFFFFFFSFKIWQYVFFFHANWLVLFIFNFTNIQFCAKITAIKFIILLTWIRYNEVSVMFYKLDKSQVWHLIDQSVQ